MAKNRDAGLKFFPKNDEQRALVKSFDENKLTVCKSRSFGSGKTYCAIGYACKKLQDGSVKTVVFCRDQSEIADRLGFMPGSKTQKIAEGMKFAVSYFKLFLGREYQIHTEAIQYRDVADLAGETFCDAIIILDEASNCSKKDIEMVISRAGQGTIVIILGNESQMEDRINGFGCLFQKLRKIPCVGLIELKEVLRNGWMAEVLEAYES